MRAILLFVLVSLSSYSLAARTNADIGDITLPFAVRPGLTGDFCESADDCTGGRKCAPRNTVDVETCEGRSDCECKFDEPQSCQNNEDCEEGELCAQSLKNSDGSSCRSAAAVQEDETLSPVDEPGTPQASPSATDGVCIDLDALTHLPTHALVFRQHPTARVLCDQYRSCATPGHIVTFHGKPMMMVSYCQIVSCESKVMKVNSPRYNRGMRVATRTKGLEYTVLAARYQTVAEERVLRAAVRFGL